VPIYEFLKSGIVALKPVTFSSVNVQERRDLQRLLRENIDIIATDTLVIAEEFGEWEDSYRRIDLLGVDKNANLVVIELKRTEDGGHMELQAIRYAAMISTMTFDRASDVFSDYLKANGKTDQDARAVLMDFLGWEDADVDKFGSDVRIVLASAEFSKEITSSVLWLVGQGLDIRCVRLKPYTLDEKILLDVQQIIPLPEVAEYQVQIGKKVRKEREANAGGADFTRYNVVINGQQHDALWKRKAIFLICKFLCTQSISPETIAALFKWRQNRVWFSVDGTVDAAEFATLAAEKAASNGGNFSPRRWFCEDAELVHANGKTYAFSDQWGGDGWKNAMNAVREAYPQFNIDFTPVI
jgi:hypothetical protein